MTYEAILQDKTHTAVTENSKKKHNHALQQSILLRQARLPFSLCSFVSVFPSLLWIIHQSKAICCFLHRRKEINEKMGFLTAG